ncbi:MAG TPA: hypothetical protein VFD32_11840 [Dehalococcoidia bacterium]|nr:hypothetical protein [Dehalococcoidia bacterium]
MIAAIERYTETETGDVVRLAGYRPPTWRLRVGDWRVFIRFAASSDGGVQRLLIERVLHRREAYR